MVIGTANRTGIIRQTVRWSGGFLACVVGFAPAAEAKGTFSPQRSFEFNRDSSRSRFAFRSVFVPPHYARQAETPLPLSWWEQGSDSPIAIAIGAAEGTRKIDGSRTAAYYWHTDPGNAADNFGSFSFQHFKPQEKAIVQQQKTVDDKRWTAARRALPEIADQRQMQRLRRFHDQLLAQARSQKLSLSELELLNGLDLANQSELAALDSWGYIDRLAQAKQLYSDPDEQIRQARTWSYWHPTLNRWDAPGLGNTQSSILRDQSRRAAAVKRVWQQEKTQPSRLAQLDAQFESETSPRNTPQRGLGRSQERWALAVAATPTEPAAGFAKQPLSFDAGPSLSDLVAETRETPSPEQQADLALAEALARDTAESDTRIEAIFTADASFEAREFETAELEAARTISLSDQQATASALEESSTSFTTPSAASQQAPGLAIGLEGSLLITSIQPPNAALLSSPTTSSNSPNRATRPEGNPSPPAQTPLAVIDQPIPDIAAGIAELPQDAIEDVDPSGKDANPSAKASNGGTPIATSLLPQSPNALSQSEVETAPSRPPSLPTVAAPPLAAVAIPATAKPPVAKASEKPKPTLSARAQRLVQPAAEAAIEGTDKLLTQHIETAAELRRQAQLEAAAKQEAEAQRQAWILQEQNMVSQPGSTDLRSPLSLALEATSTYLESPHELPNPALQTASDGAETHSERSSSKTNEESFAPSQTSLQPSGQKSKQKAAQKSAVAPGIASPSEASQDSAKQDREGSTALPPSIEAENVAESIIFFEGIEK